MIMAALQIVFNVVFAFQYVDYYLEFLLESQKEARLIVNTYITTKAYIGLYR
jgi:hypothetical protein